MTAQPITTRPEPHTPPSKATDEAKPHQHRYAHEQGAAYKTALTHMAESVAQIGGEVAGGDMIVALAVEEAEGMYMLTDGQLEWQEPESENIHIEVAVRDAGDDRFIPGLDVAVSVRDESGTQVAAGPVQFLWHPWLYHYGSNFELPGDGTYSVTVRIEPPTFPRHDKANGRRYAQRVTVEFADLEIEIGHS